MFVFLEQTSYFHHQLLLQVGVGQPELVKLVLQIIVGSSVVKSLPTRAGDSGDVGSIPGSGRSLEKERATHSSILAWKTPWTEEPGG